MPSSHVATRQVTMKQSNRVENWNVEASWVGTSYVYVGYV